MRRIAVPMVGGMVSSTILTLLVMVWVGLCGLVDLRRAEEIAVEAGGVEGKIQGFANFQQDVAAREAGLRIFRELGIDVVFDDLLAGGDFAFLAGEIDAFAKVAQDEGAPCVLGRIRGLDWLGLGFGFAGRARLCWDYAGGEAGFQDDGFADGGGKAEEDEARIGAPGAERFRDRILLRLLDGQVGELHAEFGEFLEHIQVAGAEFGGLGAGLGEDGVQGFGPVVVVSEVEHVFGGLARVPLRDR
jgi:hypothetical protein